MGSKIAALNRLQPLPPYLYVLLFKSFILPIFDYCSTVWCPSAKPSRAMEKIYSNFRLTALSIKSHCTQSLCYPEEIIIIIAVQVYKAMNGLSPPFLSEVFDLISSRTDGLFRNKYQVVTPHRRTNYGKSSFYYNGTNNCNSLNKDLYDCLDLKTLKILYKNTYFVLI